MIFSTSWFYSDGWHQKNLQGLELDETDTNPFANSDGFYPLLATILDFPFPTIALLTGHTFGGACPFALAHDYRVMNSKRGFFSMPPVNLGLHFDGIGTLPRLKLRPQIARKMLLEAHRWTSKEALADGVVDIIAEPDVMFEEALEVARQWAPKAKMGVYALLRNELWGEAAEKFRRISYVHGRMTSMPAKAKIWTSLTFQIEGYLWLKRLIICFSSMSSNDWEYNVQLFQREWWWDW